MTWNDDELRRIGGAEELQVSSVRADGSLRPYVTIWVVRAGDDIFVRSAYGSDNGWFRRAKAAGAGRIRAGGVERDVVFEEAATQDGIDQAYHDKYDRYGPAIVGSVTGPDPATLRLRPR
ncbi:DUF2255 family protein [Paractinoplanes atraurantiacus]|uniref:DUF2255 family protein n=1 Tax=Paractinoplanes atraurantiacus TaxID=1036182 RepID=A0A285JMC9_9ACTN|nr:DUF2255 family protein [Actinoplanes atraurantiacus]SNY61233.1 hypothetical protein SAMN05421748_122116 [Actinoplanes atraurantiacus]